MATHPESMYRWRQMTEAARSQLFAERQKHRLPWHSPPHYSSDSGHYLITSACYEHRPIIGASAERMTEFEQSLVATCGSACESVFAWNLLPNHYHVLVKTVDVKSSLRSLGKLHGRMSFTWNGEESTRGRQVWFNAAETGMKSERHFWASLLLCASQRRASRVR
jgi:putative transposase